MFQENEYFLIKIYIMSDGSIAYFNQEEYYRLIAFETI